MRSSGYTGLEYKEQETKDSKKDYWVIVLSEIWFFFNILVLKFYRHFF